MLQFPKPESRATEKHLAGRARLANRRLVYRLVSQRDRHLCRNCRAKGPGLHHHHLRFRSVGGQDTTANLLLLCGRCHADVHGYRMTIDGDTADGLLMFLREQR